MLIQYNQTKVRADVTRAFMCCAFQDLETKHIYTNKTFRHITTNRHIHIHLYTIYTRLYTCLTSIPRFALREKVTPIIEAPLLREWMWSSGPGRWT